MSFDRLKDALKHYQTCCNSCLGAEDTLAESGPSTLSKPVFDIDIVFDTPNLDAPNQNTAKPELEKPPEEEADRLKQLNKARFNDQHFPPEQRSQLNNASQHSRPSHSYKSRKNVKSKNSSRVYYFFIALAVITLSLLAYFISDIFYPKL